MGLGLDGIQTRRLERESSFPYPSSCPLPRIQGQSIEKSCLSPANFLALLFFQLFLLEEVLRKQLPFTVICPAHSPAVRSPLGRSSHPGYAESPACFFPKSILLDAFPTKCMAETSRKAPVILCTHCCTSHHKNGGVPSSFSPQHLPVVLENDSNFLAGNYWVFFPSTLLLGHRGTKPPPGLAGTLRI